MMTESTNNARREASSYSHLGAQHRHEIVIPLSAIRRKMPELG